jgi:ubiquinone/menaquinone biosynthesis C-methylase UbiE
LSERNGWAGTAIAVKTRMAPTLSWQKSPTAAPGIVPHSLCRLFLDHARIEAWQRCLFVGCGDGWIVEEAWRRARRGYSCGVEAAAPLVRRAQELRGIPGAVEFREWDGWRLPFRRASFHIVVSLFALARSPLPAVLQAELNRVLIPGGHVYLLEREESDQYAPL